MIFGKRFVPFNVLACYWGTELHFNFHLFQLKMLYGSSLVTKDPFSLTVLYTAFCVFCCLCNLWISNGELSPLN